MERSPPPPVTTSIHVVGAAILSGSRCFVAQRGEAMALPLKWEFPGGKVADREDPADALVREIEEELCLTIEVEGYLGRGVAGEVTLDVYTARVLSGSLHLREHHDGKWVGVDSIGAVDWADADVPVLDTLRTALQRRTNEGAEDPQGELATLVERAGDTFQEPESLELMGRLRSRGFLGDLQWLEVLAWLGNAMRALPAPTVRADGGFSPDADPRNADWIKIVRARRRAKHCLPSWAALWLWRMGGFREEPGFWETVEEAAEAMGLAKMDDGMG